MSQIPRMLDSDLLVELEACWAPSRCWYELANGAGD